ncbi:MAG: TonB-dependent receptor [Balneolaceae bacterium]
MQLKAFDDISGIITGIILDAENDEPVAHAYIHIEELNRFTYSDRNGQFVIRNLPQGNYNLLIHRLGYSSQSISFNIQTDDEKEISIRLTPTVLTGGSLVVISESDGLRGSNLEHASIKLTGSTLRRNIGTTLSETLSNQPGFEQRSMGLAPARPVIRGLGDERVLILQDGERTGDFSASASDHALTIDPVSADEIEIARGPAALEYGSNAIGGVINVVRNQIATSVPSSLNGAATIQASSVNEGASVAGVLSIPMDNYVLNLDLSGRYGNNFQTPSGTVKNSDYLSTSNAIGLSTIRSWGYSGISVSGYLNNYGIPPDPIGGHEEGVDIEMSRFQIENRSEILLEHSFFKLLETQLSYRYYNHKEFETSEIIGTEMTRNSTNFTAKLRHRNIGFIKDGVVGFWSEFNDTYIFDRFNIETNGLSASLFTIQEANFGPFHLETGFRLDFNTEIPKQDKPESRIGNIRQRSFIGLASSASLIYNFNNGYQLGTTIMHSFRPPTSNELFSEGPHIAAYSFEIGNPDLDPERGFGKELFLRFRDPGFSLDLTGYHNSFSNFIYSRDTGRENIFFPSLNDFQFTGLKAVIYGFEAQTEFEILQRFVLKSSLSYTLGKRDVTEEEIDLMDNDQKQRDYLPLMPPLRLTIGAEYSFNSFSVGGDMRYVARQDRTTMFEEPTDAFTIFNLRADYRKTTKNNLLHTLSLSVNNLFDTEYRNHLSRLKEIFPEPGRNINLLYRLYF